MLFRSAVAICVIVGISACSDPTDANKRNFKSAIQAYLDTNYPKCYVYANFPRTIDRDYSGLAGKLRALAKTGLLTETEVQVEERSVFSRPKKFVNAPMFDLTEEGKKYYKAKVAKTIRGKSVGGFCAGNATVKEITQFSVPSDMFGHRISRVNYTYEVSNFPAWAEAPEVLAAIKDLNTDFESKITSKKALDVLILTNNGWVHEKLFEK